ncbi:MAG: hypothetical protein D6797_05260 [Bdellovibrio sp.]|nr:MAG: hypothetical protein D6797_05260 [Bdellovibrio sp.]
MMKKIRIFKFFLVVLLFFSGPLKASFQKITIQVSKDSPRLFEDMSEPTSPMARQFFILKKFQVQKNYSACLKKARALQKRFPSFKSWLLIRELECGKDLVERDLKKGLLLKSPLQRGYRQLFNMKVQSSAWNLLRKTYVAALLKYLQYQVNYFRLKAWESVEKLEEMKKWLTKSQAFQFYRLSGDLAFVQQNLDLAANLYKKSLTFKKDLKVQSRLISLRKTLGLLEKSYEGADYFSPLQNVDLEATEEERLYVKRIRDYLKRGKILPAVETGIRLINDYPGGVRAQWAADRVITAYLRVLRHRDRRFVLLKEKILKAIIKAPPDRLLKWAEVLKDQEKYREALYLSEKSVEKFKKAKTKKLTKATWLAAWNALLDGKYDKAQKYFGSLIKEHAGSPEAREAFFRQGLLKYRLGKYGEAVAFLEKYLSLPRNDKYELSVLYWLWRAKQQLKAAEASTIAQKLSKKYPLTYYGLRARAELAGGKLSLPEGGQPVKSITVWLTEERRQEWQRYLTFVNAGWFREAQLELQAFYQPRSPEEKLVFADLYARCLNYHEAITLANEAWDQRPHLITVFWIKRLFPKLYWDKVKTYGTRYALDPLLILGLIRQESSFRAKGQSGAGALGLMQLMPLTAREVARNLRKKITLPEDLFQPSTNILFGTLYLSRMYRAFNGNVPLALAAYNVGIGNIRKWQSSREAELFFQTNDSSPQNEIWIEELPWTETQFYVKAVLRNFLIYRLLEEWPEEVPASNPIWALQKYVKTADK